MRLFISSSRVRVHMTLLCNGLTAYLFSFLELLFRTTVPIRCVICQLSQSYFLDFHVFDWVIAKSHNIPGVITFLVATVRV